MSPRPIWSSRLVPKTGLKCRFMMSRFEACSDDLLFAFATASGRPRVVERRYLIAATYMCGVAGPL